MDPGRFSIYLLIASACAIGLIVRKIKGYGELAAWKIWLSSFLLCSVFNRYGCLEFPPFQFWLCLFVSAVLSVPVSELIMMMCPGVYLRYPWDAWVEERQRRCERKRRWDVDQRPRSELDLYAYSKPGAWFGEQVNAVMKRREVEPPWIVFPDKDPCWMGWREGAGTAWIKLIWYPYWNKISVNARRMYLERWSAPDNWLEYLHPDRGTSKATVFEKRSTRGRAENLWLKDTTPHGGLRGGTSWGTYWDYLD